MALNATFRHALASALKKYEGSRDYFYRDSIGQVTIGVGHLVSNEAEAACLKLTHRSDLKPATAPEIIAAFRAVKAESFTYRGENDHKTRTWGSAHYKNLAGASDIFMTAHEIDWLLDRHIDEFHRYLQRNFTVAHGYKREFDSFSDNVRLALFDMIFNLGPTKFPSRWPTLVKALKAEDWQAAAQASVRHQLSPARNLYVHSLLLAGCTVPPPVTSGLLTPALVRS